MALLIVDECVVGELVREVVERVLEQADTKPVEVRAPEKKTAFPKILCPDMNKWVDLGNAHYVAQLGAVVRAGVRQRRLQTGHIKVLLRGGPGAVVGGY